MTQSDRRQGRRQDRRQAARQRSLYLRRRIMATLALVIIITVGIVLGVTLGGGDKEGSRSTTVSSERDPTTAPGAGVTTTQTADGGGTPPTTAQAGDGGEGDSEAPPVEQEVTSETAKAVGANELGRIPVLMFHLIGTGNNYLTPDQLRFNIAMLRTHGFYPTTVREMVEGTMDIPAGKSPVVFTFDDSSPGQYRILEDGTIDPDCAVGILQSEVEWGLWAPKATFFPLLEVNGVNILFGQPDYAQEKLQNLVEWGYEVGSHGLSHMDFSRASVDQVKREVGGSQARLEELIGGGYKLFTLSPPYGEYPKDRSILLAGEYEGIPYSYQAVVMAWGESSPSPFSEQFDPVRIPRITAAAPEAVRKLMKYWKEHRHLLYISDGDPDTISYPQDVPEELGGLRPGLSQRVVEY